MNVYDQAHALAGALKQSEEYQVLQAARERLENDHKNKEMLVDLRRGQWELEADRVLGKEIDEQKEKRLEQLTELVNLNPTLRDYLAAEFRFARLMTDIQKILTDALTDWFQAAAEMFQNQE